MRVALIRDGVVENVILIGETYEPPEGCTVYELANEPVGPGWLYDGETFTEPEPLPPPDPEPPSQMALMQEQINELTDLVLFGLF